MKDEDFKIEQDKRRATATATTVQRSYRFRRAGKRRRQRRPFSFGGTHDEH
jgi:hypothetical protein